MRPPPPPMASGSLLLRVVTLECLLTAVAIALPGAVRGWFGFGLGRLLIVAFLGSLVGYYFQIIAHIGDDQEGLPGLADTVSDLSSLRRMMTRGILCLAVAAAPFLVFRAQGGDVESPAAIATVLAGLLYLPAIVVAVALTQSTAAALWPVAWVRVVARAPLSYATLVLLFGASSGVGVLVYVALHKMLGGVPFVGAWVALSAVTMIAFAQAVLVGAFLHRHAEDFGYR
jgi:hypothetical protein